MVWIFSGASNRRLLSDEDASNEREETVPTEDYDASTTDSPQDPGDYDYLSDNNDTYCIQPEITHFPDPLINKRTRQHGAIILHILLAIYVFIGNDWALHCN